MEHKIILITGATDGIGKETAKTLEQQEHTVIIHGRNTAKAEAVRQELTSQTGNTTIDVLIADLFSLADVNRAADAFRKKYKRLDVLINNAGAMFGKVRETTPEGLEKTMTLNLFAPLLLTELLLDVLVKSPAARIVNVNSEMHRRGGKPDFTDFQLEKSYTAPRAYGLSKLYAIWVNRYLISELATKGLNTITVNTAHPGMVNTKFGQDVDKGFVNNLIFKIALPFMATVDKGAATSVYLATSPDVAQVTGKYFGNKKEETVNEQYYSAENAATVWAYCQQIISPHLSIAADSPASSKS